MTTGVVAAGEAGIVAAEAAGTAVCAAVCTGLTGAGICTGDDIGDVGAEPPILGSGPA